MNREKARGRQTDRPTDRQTESVWLKVVDQHEKKWEREACILSALHGPLRQTEADRNIDKEAERSNHRKDRQIDRSTQRKEEEEEEEEFD